MGLSAPPPASIDLIGSFARRRGQDVELVLWAPSKAQHATTIELGQRSTTVAGAVRLVEDEQGQRLVATAPRRELGDGQWTLTVSSPEGDRYTVEARLLVQGERPLVLLWGGKAGRTEVPAPRRALTKKRVAASGGQVLDKVLTTVPPDTAVSVRAAVRRTARRILR